NITQPRSPAPQWVRCWVGKEPLASDNSSEVTGAPTPVGPMLGRQGAFGIR
ncbi:11945_t:CDS:1, partial [Acaulospora colombiana]